MIKVSQMSDEVILSRLPRFDEDALCSILDHLFDCGRKDTTLWTTVSERLEEVSSKKAATEAKAAALLKAEKDAQLARIAELEALVNGQSGRYVMRATVAEFGGDFESDYTIGEDFSVTSTATSERYNYHGQTWQHASLEEAKKHVFLLIYYRAFDRHFRNDPSADDLTRLKAAILELQSKGE